MLNKKIESSKSETSFKYNKLNSNTIMNIIKLGRIEIYPERRFAVT